MCEKCGSDGGLKVDIQLGDGTEISFSACGHCEQKMWRAPEGTVSLKKVLELATVNRPL